MLCEVIKPYLYYIIKIPKDKVDKIELKSPSSQKYVLLVASFGCLSLAVEIYNTLLKLNIFCIDTGFLMREKK